MKTALIVIMAGFVATGARADLISISVENGFSGSNGLSGTLDVVAGMDYLVTGTLTNVGADMVILNSDADCCGSFAPTTPAGFNTDGGLAFDEPPNEVDSLGLGDSAVDIDLFELDVLSGTSQGPYDLTYAVMDTNSLLIGAGTIEVDVEAPAAPEPGPLGLMGIGFGILGAYRRHRFRKA